MARLLDRLQKTDIIPALKTKLSRDNVYQHPLARRSSSIWASAKAGFRTRTRQMEQAADQLTQIAGQRAQITKAKVAISNFRLRENSAIGCRVTLRGKRMYEFLDRLISVALPRIRDFRGINPKSFDGNGNYSMGLTEQMVFPEIDPDKVTFTQGMDITFVTNTRSDEEARELLRSFGHCRSAKQTVGRPRRGGRQKQPISAEIGPQFRPRTTMSDRREVR